MKINAAVVTPLLAAGALVASGCAGHRFARSTTSPGAPTSVAGMPVGPDGGLNAAEPTVRNEAMHPIPQLKDVTFEFDSSRLSKDASVALRGNAEWLKKNQVLRVQVAGNCDERGTVAYNLALGQRRAKVVRDYYMMLGVDGARIATISYGKEKPLCRESNEACWRLNRRAATLGGGELMVGRVGR